MPNRSAGGLQAWMALIGRAVTKNSLAASARRLLSMQCMTLNSTARSNRINTLPTARTLGAHHRVRVAFTTCTLGLALVGCAQNADEPDYGEAASELSISSYERNSCSTTVVLGLSRQIADEVNCMMPGQLVRFSPTANIKFTSAAVLPYLDPAGLADLKAAAAGTTITVNSGFRTVAQQYLLYRWRQLGRCRITAAAAPGRSNHESGRALDVSNYSAVRSKLSARGWKQTVAGDLVHFDHISSPDIRGADVQAFQRLWNKNHPEDKIAEDGDYGPMTAARLARSPGEGFTKGPSCGNSQLPDPSLQLPDPSVPDESDDEGEDAGIDSDDSDTNNAAVEGGCQSSGSSSGGVAVALMCGLIAVRRKRAVAR
ncbi:MAG TPA: M15 family metallopeptidase [Kofleriaceae bacterium]|nr:M15 family metallopeptidase [Kofleriaceae bacterium]